MLGKLMKHEFRATGRIGLPLCGIMMALSVVAGMVIRLWSDNLEYGWREQAGSIIIFLYGLSVFAVGIGIFIVLMQHYKRNLLGDEGYLMRTLPVNIHELLLSKLFVALLWYIASILLTMLSGLVVVFISGEVKLSEFGGLMDVIRDGLASTDAYTWLCAFLAYIGGMSLLTLLFYADYAMTQSFSKHKVLYSVIFVVVFIVLLRLVFWFNSALVASGFGAPYFGSNESGVYVSHGAEVGLIELYLSCVLVYFITWAFLKYKPNLE
ncbi:MAG: hypothetical protein J5449_08505 [Oscillospiraceae bacterium]|nr:hypothetical protein [Oscillospiraceae bacterium]